MRERTFHSWIGFRLGIGIGCGVSLLALAVGCIPLRPPHTPTRAGIDASNLRDPDAFATDPPAPMQKLIETAELVRQARKPADGTVPRKRSVLVLSGGGAYGAYCAGFLVGWTETGTRPEFDVVTGVSTGSLIAGMAFVGQDFDPELVRVYTTLGNRDLYRLKVTPHALISESFADNSRLRKQIERLATPENLQRVAAEHARGRRLYIGTTDLESRRPVVWDMGAIASRGTPESRQLFIDVLLASAAIPGFFPPVKIPVSIDGQCFVERHIDGGATQAVFYRPPHIPPQLRDTPAGSLYGSDVYVLLAGKVYADPDPVRRWMLAIAGSSVTSLIYAQTRSDLVKVYAASALEGMRYNLSAIPQDFPAPKSATDFDPKEMRKLFEEGRRQACRPDPWSHVPPGQEDDVLQRTGTCLKRVPQSGGVGPLSGEPYGFPPRAESGVPIPPWPLTR